MFTCFNEPFSFDDNEPIFDFAVTYMDDEIREQLHAELAPCSRDQFMAAYAARDPEILALLAAYDVVMEE